MSEPRMAPELGMARELAAGLSAVREAAAICRRVQATIAPETMSKQDQSPVTIADFGSQAVVCRVLRTEFPADPLIAEEDATELRVVENAAFLHRVHEEVCSQCIEASPDQVCRWIDHGSAQHFSPRFWTLDPIDGTKGFLRKEQYAISLALIIGGKIELAILGCPNLPGNDPSAPGVVFYAIRGAGAFMLPLDDLTSTGERIHVSSQTDPSQLRFCESVEAGHSAHGQSARIAQALGTTATPVRLDSQAKYGVVARGEAEAYLRLPTRPDYREMIWDHAGGVLVVEEAGGRVTDTLGKPLEFTHGRRLETNLGVIASNGALHDAVLKAVQTTAESKAAH